MEKTRRLAGKLLHVWHSARTGYGWRKAFRGMGDGRFNCWEYQGCGREPGGPNVNGAGPCPAAVEAGLHGSNGGTNAGRACWVIAGTLCEGRVCGSYQEKYVQCHKCSFYRRVEVEQGLDWEGDVDLLLKYGDSIGR